MDSQTAEGTDRALIRELLEKWALAVRFDKKDEVLANHAADALIFDVLPPLKYEGIDAYRNSWDQWQPEFEIPSLFDIHELNIVAGTDVGFAHFLIQCGGTLPDGEQIEEWVRATLCFRKEQDQWKVVHQHVSLPLFIEEDDG